jgi:hypothetical protein
MLINLELKACTYGSRNKFVRPKSLAKLFPWFISQKNSLARAWYMWHELEVHDNLLA